MWGPVKHHRALGIHPGAYVQPSAPATVDVQDRTLWVDTSTAEPWQLKSWDQAAGVWRLVGAINPAGLPAGITGDVLYFDGIQWVTLPIGAFQQDLQVEQVGQDYLPRWADPCCADTGTPIGPPQSSERCGAALAMAQLWIGGYQDVRTVLTAVIGGAIKKGIIFVIDALAAALAARFEIPVSAEDQPFIFGLAHFVIGIIPIPIVPDLSLTQQNAILQAAYCALPSAGTTFTVSRSTLTAMLDNLQAHPAGLDDHQLQILSFVLGVAPPTAWQVAAFQGSTTPSSLCAGFTCKLGTGLQGGVLLRGGAGGGIQGGVLLSGGAGGGLRGGALLNPQRGTGLSGGAVLA